MRTRHVLLGTIVLAVASSGATAYAAKKPTPMCKMITDPDNDGGMKPAGFIVKSDAAEITGGDVASGKKTVVGLLRVKSTSISGDTWGNLGVTVNLSFVVQGATYTFSRSYSGSSVTNRFKGAAGWTDLPASQVKVTGTEIRWTVPRSAVPGLKKPRQTFSGISASSTINGTGADAAPTTKKIGDQYPSCLKPA